VPFERLRSIRLEAPADLRDVVWMPAKLGLTNGGEASALIPTRYPGSESDRNGLIRLSRKTEWDEVVPDTFHGPRSADVRHERGGACPPERAAHRTRGAEA